MTSKPTFKIVFATIITGIFGYLMYMLVDSVRTGFFFVDETDQKVLISGIAMMCGPIVLAIICSIIRKRFLWIWAVVNLFLLAMVGGGFGDETTMAHAYVYGGMILVPYILCMIMILGEKKKEEKKETSSYVSTRSSYSGSSYSGSSYGSSSGSMSFSEKEAYIRSHCHSAYSTTAMERIDNDSSLTDSQKEDIKNHLRYYGD